IESKFAAAFREDKLLATKMLFYSGDIRQGGLGERRTFRICLRWLAENYPEIVNKNIELIPYFNRFDSWFVLCGTKCEKLMWENVARTLAADMKAYNASVGSKHVPVSLLAKWMPSENTSSEKTRQMAVKAQRALQLTPRKYRKMLSALRKHINVTERMMSAGEWAKIDYAKVPSYAMHNYGSAFAKHDHERFDAYLKSVNKGETKINAATLYPYDLVERYMGGSSWANGRAVCGDCVVSIKEDAVVEAQWKALPNYLTKPMNAVVMADVSGSMRGRPMATSIGLAIYFAQHNTGLYHNQYMTFTSEPHFVNIKEGASLLENVQKVAAAGVGYSTNLERAFQEVLDVAVANRVPVNQMPKTFVVISDMEIDKYMRPGRHWDFLKVMEARYNAKGYKLPKIVMWNVNARKDTVLSQDESTIFISGQSPSSFKALCQNLDGITAYELMLQVLNGKAYEKVRI
ncbi:MAG: DUF2828 family protein, partial [Prevotella sp.]|nr:DUF2828 family protein [Prevotella sp.]